MARLHGRELNDEEKYFLQSKPFAEHFACATILHEESFASIVAQLEKSLHCSTEVLQSEYAALYLNFMARVSPCVSFYVDKDHLLRQEPTFELANIYAQEQYKLETPSPLGEDHIAILLSFLSLIFFRNPPRLQQGWGKNFIQTYLLSWLPLFLEGCLQSKFYAHGFYRHLFAFTENYLRVLLDFID